MKKYIKIFMFIAFFLFTFTSCTVTTEVSIVKIEDGILLELEEGSTHQLTIEENVNITGSLEFTSSDECVSVDRYGLLTANYEGEAIITVSFKEHSDSIKVRVTPIKNISVSISCDYDTYYIGDDFDASKFIKKAVDETRVIAAMKDEIDLNVEDTHKVEVDFRDEGNNTVTKTVKLIVKKDTEPPVIETPTQITVVKGENVLYKKQVTVTDNRDGEITNFTVDNSNVNLSKVGSYYVTYSAIDKNGNEATKKRKRD